MDIERHDQSGGRRHQAPQRQELPSHGGEGLDWRHVGDVLAGYEYQDQHRSSRRQIPEYRLIEEVLLDAVELAVQFKRAPAISGKRLREQMEAWEWLFETVHTTRAFSAESICEWLGVDLTRLRAHLEAGDVGKLRGRRTGVVANGAMAIRATRESDRQRAA